MRHVVIAVIGVALWVIGFIVSIVVGAGNQPWARRSATTSCLRGRCHSRSVSASRSATRVRRPRRRRVRARDRCGASPPRRCGCTGWHDAAVLLGSRGAWQYLKVFGRLVGGTHGDGVPRALSAASLLVLVADAHRLVDARRACADVPGGWIRTLRGWRTSYADLLALRAYLLGLDLRRAARQPSSSAEAVSFPTG
jgi:hypothetical protein